MEKSWLHPDIGTPD